MAQQKETLMDKIMNEVINIGGLMTRREAIQMLINEEGFSSKDALDCVMWYKKVRNAA